MCRNIYVYGTNIQSGWYISIIFFQYVYFRNLYYLIIYRAKPKKKSSAINVRQQKVGLPCGGFWREQKRPGFAPLQVMCIV